MFTLEQLHEYFSDRYTPEQVNRALDILAQNGADIDINSNQFSLDITEELEEIFKAVGAALDNQKKIGQSEELTVMEASAIASKYSQHSNPQLMAAMIRLVTEEAIAEGAALTQIKSHVLGQVLQQGDAAIAQSLLGRNQQTINYVQALASSPGQINKMLSGYGVQSVDVDAFLIEVRGNSAGVKKAVQAIAPAQEKTFDIDAFLLEAGE